MKLHSSFFLDLFRVLFTAKIIDRKVTHSSYIELWLIFRNKYKMTSTIGFMNVYTFKKYYMANIDCN